MKKSKIIICGKAASGKDFLKKKFEARGFSREISYTTRSPRVGEENGVDYWFITKEAFLAAKDAGDFYEAQEFNGWWYGTTKTQFYEKDLFIMTPSGLTDVLPEDREKCFVIFLDVDFDIRKERLLLRSDADKVERRLAADEADFKDFKNYDIRITDPNF